MSVFTQGNWMSVFISKDASFSTPSASADVLATLSDGQITAVGRKIGDNNETVLQSPGAGTFDYFRFAYKVNGILVYGPKVDLKNQTLISAYKTLGAAGQEQIWSVGYNGTTGDLDVTQSNEFMLTIAYDHDDILWSEQKLRNTYDYYSASPTKKGLAQSMTSQINYKEQLGLVNGTGVMVRAEMFADGTGTALTGTNLSATLGSNYITLASAQTLAVGDLIRIGGTAVTNPVYVISALGDANGNNTTTIYQIHTPFQGTTSSAVAGATVGSSTKYGFTLKGQALTWIKDFFKYNKVKFHLDLKGFGDVTITKTQESKKGIGQYQEVAEMESFAAGNEGILNRMKIPFPTGRSYTDSTKTYDVVTISSADYTTSGNSNAITGNTPMRIQQFLFFPNTAQGVTNRGLIATQLNTLLGASL